MSAPVALLGIASLADVAAPVAPDWLSASERARLDGLRHAGRRAQYLAGHWLARELLAARFGGPARAWSLQERRSLPPAVQGADTLRVSISHSGDWVAAAVADAAIGIDLEQRPRRLEGAIEALLREPGEAPGALDADLLLQRWVAKEAWIKRAAGSALPPQLAQLRLQAAAAADADVRVLSHARFHLALALPADCALRHAHALPLVAGPAWTLRPAD